MPVSRHPKRYIAATVPSQSQYSVGCQPSQHVGKAKALIDRMGPAAGKGKAIGAGADGADLYFEDAAWFGALDGDWAKAELLAGVAIPSTGA